MLSKTFQASKSELKTIRSFVKSFLTDNKINLIHHDSIILAVGEITSNILEHGYNFKESDKIKVDLSFNNNEIKLKFFDNGQIVDIEKIKSRELNDIKPGGLGIFFINEIFDDIHWVKGDPDWNNVLEIKKRL
jgi:serine/threonine-protein kinase RsbW